MLRKHFGNDFTLVEYKSETLLPPGENFSSIIIKIEVKARRTSDSPVTEDFYFVGKTMVPATAFYNKTDFGYTLIKEAFMYTNIIPLYAKIERECGFAEKESIANLIPKMYGYRLSLDPNATIADEHALMLMENLNVQDYYVVDKNIGLDLEHARCAMKALARFHSLGIAARRKFPTKFETLKMEAGKNLYNIDLITNLYEKFIDYMRHEARLAVYFDRVESIINRLKGTRRFEERTHELWSTIVHHDFWTNNMMFRKDDVGRLNSIKFIDFQLYVFVDLFVDLSYFLCTSLNDVATEHFDELLSVYYDAFELNLRRLGVDVSGYTKKAFDERYMQVASYDLPRNILAVIFVTTEFDNVKDPKNIAPNFLAWKGNEESVRILLRIFQLFEGRGWLC